jgi:hypothetical protein
MMAAGEVGLLLTECRANDSAQPSVFRVAIATCFFGLLNKVQDLSYPVFCKLAAPEATLTTEEPRLPLASSFNIGLSR